MSHVVVLLSDVLLGSVYSFVTPQTADLLSQPGWPSRWKQGGATETKFLLDDNGGVNFSAPVSLVICRFAGGDVRQFIEN